MNKVHGVLLINLKVCIIFRDEFLTFCNFVWKLPEDGCPEHKFGIARKPMFAIQVSKGRKSDLLGQKIPYRFIVIYPMHGDNSTDRRIIPNFQPRIRQYLYSIVYQIIIRINTEKTFSLAMRNTGIVSSLFPSIFLFIVSNSNMFFSHPGLYENLGIISRSIINDKPYK
ncbi:hypothetical protein SDC9_143900 [bioreactor metagenome]|uniref:Uncharacterized protein n=1 Tax=bioreactor metagenome TaxID=1076179 RepID=A0A645E5F8_9ZZZZ